MEVEEHGWARVHTALHVLKTRERMDEYISVGAQSHLSQVAYKTLAGHNKINGLRGREGSTRVAFAPPLALEKRFSQPGCGQNFPLFSRVMREGPSTGPCAERPGSVLSGPIFSKADDWADLVISFNTLNMNGYFQRSFWSVCEIVRFAEKTGVVNALSKNDFPKIISAERDTVRYYVLCRMFALASIVFCC